MDKKEFRKQCLEVRRGIEEKEEKSQIIQSMILGNPLYQEAKVVALYNSTPSEVATKELIKCSIRQKNVVLLPKVKDKALKFVRVEEHTLYEESSFHIEEPIEEEEYTGPIDLMIVPGVAFTKEGQRLGYGGGFYDRYLKGKKIPTIALCFEGQIVEDIPTEDHDVRVDKVQTEENLYEKQKENQKNR